MWKQLAKFVLKFRLIIIILVLSLTAWMGYFAKKAELSYEFSRALPKSDTIYKANESFKKMFGDDGNLLVIGVKSKDFFKFEFEKFVYLCRLANRHDQLLLNSPRTGR